MQQANAARPGVVASPRTGWTALPRAVARDVVWSFRAPRTWLAGVTANLLLATAWLAALPITGRHRGDWVVIFGSFYAEFILADVTTTNVLGPDQARVNRSIAEGHGVARILLIKNLALMIIVGVPILALTALFTIRSEGAYRLSLTLPGVAFPILTWLGVGDIVSVLLPVRTLPVRWRWRRRRDLRFNAVWAGHLALPYLLLYVVDPLMAVPGMIGAVFGRDVDLLDLHGAVLAAAGLLFWAAGLATASMIGRRHPIRFR
jgi:hypothetical protein